MSDRPVLVMAGGTGGHVFPGLAVARALTDAGVPVEWLGTHRGLEAKLVPPTGIPVNFVSVGGLRGKSLMTRLLGPVRIVWAVIQSLVVMARLRPRTVLGMGGFVSGPGGIAAWITRRRLVIHEQNAIAGLTNRLLSRLAGQVLQAFPSTFPEEVEAVTVGNPVRPEISAIEPPATRLAIPRDRARLLVFGGSQGAAKSLNRPTNPPASMPMSGLSSTTWRAPMPGPTSRYAVPARSLLQNWQKRDSVPS
jgi:UDP-N-acetylglucosamine--N-acetylmuramyl-(pentapeptide) pyrophosphoryl-undecaprenol N-acetylglucosamine transferase